MLTKQAIYNRALDGVIRQGGQSMGDGSCVYRAGDDRRCGIGQLLEDQYYDPAFDLVKGGGGGVTDLMQDRSLGGGVGQRFYEAMLASGVDLEDPSTLRFCQDLQSAHDMMCGMTDFRLRMARVADRYNLISKPLKGNDDV